MKIHWSEERIKYDGEQLKPLYNYLKHGVLGTSLVAWRGPCDVTIEHMIDGEDVRAGAKIAADEMVHFIAEIFDFSLKGGVLLQRLMAEMALDTLENLTGDKQMVSRFERRGDDLYLDGKKFNISIATTSSNSVLVHFAVNAKNTGAPVPVISLSDFKVAPEDFARDLLERVKTEMVDVLEAAQKIRPL